MASLPPGFRFNPTHEELVEYYLKSKVAGSAIEYDFIPEINVYKQEPWDLPAAGPGSDTDLFFFSQPDKKYAHGVRANRATKTGYWKATGKDKNVKKLGRTVVGMRKTLVFHLGRAPHAKRTNWVMHEYRLADAECDSSLQESFVLCRVFKKRKVGARSADDRGQAQTDVDEDIDDEIIDKEPTGSFAAEAVNQRALELAESTLEALPAQSIAGQWCWSESLSGEGAGDAIALTISVDDYISGEGARDTISMQPSVQDYRDLQEPSLGINNLEDQFPLDRPSWIDPASITSGLGLPSDAAGSSTAPKFSVDRFLEAWEAVESREARNGEARGNFDHMFKMAFGGEADDNIPPLEEEPESSKPSNQSIGGITSGLDLPSDVPDSSTAQEFSPRSLDGGSSGMMWGSGPSGSVAHPGQYLQQEAPAGGAFSSEDLDDLLNRLY
ncbi:unnamed protein product [Calypogeia fissa]